MAAFDGNAFSSNSFSINAFSFSSIVTAVRSAGSMMWAMFIKRRKTP